VLPPTNGVRLQTVQAAPWLRRLDYLIDQHTADLGGEEALSHSERVLIARCGMLCLQLELQEQSFARSEGGMASADALVVYSRCLNSLHRVLATLGLKRRPRDINTPTVAAYLRTKQQQEAYDVDAEAEE
jgi:hypothetical protein